MDSLKGVLDPLAVFMDPVAEFMNWLNGIVWGPLMIILLVGTGIYLTFRLRFVQMRYLLHGIKCISGKYEEPGEKEGELTHFQALTAALSATIGTGNIAGVATAIALGGPGAVFWMWITALAGMATKFTSCALALKYRVIKSDGFAAGGPMYFLSFGLKQKWLGFLFALFAGLASFGIGCAVQSNSVTDALLNLLPPAMHGPNLTEDTPLLKPVIGLMLAGLVGVVILGGIRRIASVASRIVPIMCAFYIFGALIVLIRFAPAVPGAFLQIFYYAFTPLAAGSGFVGMVVSRTIQKGVARGVFSNESGLGSAPMAYAALRSRETIRAGFVAMVGPFVDTIVVCTMTALVILVTGVWQVHAENGELLYGPGGKGVPLLLDGEQVVGMVGENAQPFLNAAGEPYAIPTGAALTADAFEAGLGPLGGWVVALGIVLFAYSTMISWSYFGDRCWQYMLGDKAVKPYRVIYCCFVFIGTISGLDLIWTIADNLNALMAIPNLIGLLGLAGIISKELKDYLRRMKAEGEL